MLIANPIYDVVFKYLMEDAEIARRLLSVIIGQEIIELNFQPQEYIGRSDAFDVIILRLDFKAIIQIENGEQKKVLIELQKGKNPVDILRFRRYLADNYRNEDVINGKKVSLPIITIYFLGFKLLNILTPVVKVNRFYFDLINDVKIETKEAFIEQLTHDSYVIQIPRLKKQVRNELETVLKVFNQAYVSDDTKILIFDESEIDNDLLVLMTKRLRKAATEEEVLRKIEIEEEVENTIELHIREKQDLKEKVTDQETKLSEQETKLNEQETKLSEQEKLIEKLKKQLGDKS